MVSYCQEDKTASVSEVEIPSQAVGFIRLSSLVGYGVDFGHWHSRVVSGIVTQCIPDLSAMASALHRALFSSA